MAFNTKAGWVEGLNSITQSVKTLVTNNHIGIIGDSITAACSSDTSGTESNGYLAHALAMSGQAYVFKHEYNFGIGGQTSADVLLRTDAPIASYPNTFILAIGTNDRGSANLTAEQTIYNISKIIKRLRTAGKIVVVCTPNPRGESTYPSNRLSGQQLANHMQVRRWILQLKQANVYSVDTWKYLVDPLSSTADAKLTYTSDGLHNLQLGAFYQGKAIAEVLSVIKPLVSVLPVSNADLYNATTNVSGSITTNPMMLTTPSGGTTAVAASGTYTFTGTHTDGQTITIGSTTYTLKTALSTGPTVANEVLRSSTNSSMVSRLVNAINGGSGLGTNYSTGTVANTQVSAVIATDTSAFTVTALSTGTAGNSIATTDTVTNGAWGAATLAGGVAAAAGNTNVLADGYTSSKATGTTAVTLAYSYVTTATGNWTQVVIAGGPTTAAAAVDIARQISIHTNMVVGSDYEGVVEFEVDVGASGLESLQLGLYVTDGTISTTLWDCDRYTVPSVLPAVAHAGIRRTPPVKAIANMTDARLRLSCYLPNTTSPSATIRFRAMSARQAI